MVKTRDGVAPLLVDKVAASGVSSVSQYVADLLAIHVGLPALVRELNQAAVAHGAARTVAPLHGDRLMIRPRREVSQRLAHMAAEAGYPQAGCRPTSPTSSQNTSVYIADSAKPPHRPPTVKTAPLIDIQRDPATETAAGPPVKAVTGREAARAEMRRLAQRAAERRAEEAAREAARREATVRAVRRPQPAE